MLRVEGEPDLVRTPQGIIQNVNQDSYQAYIAKRKSMAEQKTKIEKLESDVAEMKTTLATILQLLTEKK